MPVALTKGLNHKCCDCGIALKQNEVGGEFIGRIVDYGEHKTTEFDGVTSRLLLCSGCLERLKEIRAKDQGDAILKRKEIEKDGPGPLKPLVFPDTEIDDFRTPDGAGVGM